MNQNKTPRCVRILSILALVAMVLYTIFFLMIVFIPQAFYQVSASPYVNSGVDFPTPWLSVVTNAIILVSYVALIVILLKKPTEQGWNRHNTFLPIILVIVIPIVQCLFAFIVPAIEFQYYINKGTNLVVAYTSINSMFNNIRVITHVALLLCVSAVSILRYHIYMIGQLESPKIEDLAIEMPELIEPIIENPEKEG